MYFSRNHEDFIDRPNWDFSPGPKSPYNQPIITLHFSQAVVCHNNYSHNANISINRNVNIPKYNIFC